MNRHLGTRLDIDDIGNYLKSIEFEVEKIDPDRLRVIPPSCRVDISRFEDITEEVARLYGYNNIETTFPLIPAEATQPSKTIESRDRIKFLMTGLGFTEAINYSFISERSCNLLELPTDDTKRQVVKILNPLSEDQSVMRTSLVPGLLETMKYNLSVQNKNLKLFEIGKVFVDTGQEDTQPNEFELISGLWTGTAVDSAWFSKTVDCDFYDLKGVVEQLLERLRLGNTTFTRMPPESCYYTKPGATAQILVNNDPMGLVGELHPKVLANYDLKQTGFIFELDLDRLIQLLSDEKAAHSIPKYPATSRDMTLIINKDVEANKIIQYVKMLDEELVETILLFDVFEGSPIPEKRKSVSLRITYRSLDETLEDNRVNHIHKNITQLLVEKFEATLPAE